MSTRIYLDHAATTPLRPEARRAMEEGFALWANPSSPHREGRRARNALERARERIKASLDWNGELIFTSGASEALALALGRSKASRQLVLAIEHDAVLRAAPDARELPLLNGVVDFGFLKAELAGAENCLVAIQHTNSETGTIQPVDACVELARDCGGLLLSDCSQSAGKYPLPDADMIVISAHKFGGPVGVGALLVRDYAMLEPGGGHERGYRAGTENLPGALGMAAALEAGGGDAWTLDEPARMAFCEQMSTFGDRVSFGTQASHIFAFTHPQLSAQALLIRLDAMGFAVSAGSACSSGTLKQSRVLRAFGVDEDRSARTIRISLGWNNTQSELDAFASAWESLVSA